MCNDQSGSLKSIVCCLLLFTSLRADGADATGFVRYEECGLMVANHLYLERFQSHNLEKVILLKLPGPLEEVPKDWFGVPVTDCSGPSQCTTAATAKIQLLHVSYLWWGKWRRRRQVSGNFAVQFPDGRKLEGSFEAKVRKSSTEIICE